MSNPNLLFLDEPTVGMDIQSRKAMHSMVRKIRDEFGTTVFLTTHHMEEAEMLSDRICIINNGKEVAQGTTDELKGYLHKNILSINFVSSNAAVLYRSILKKEFGINDIDINQNRLFINTNDDSSCFNKINYFLLDQKVEFLGIETIKPTLEEVFINLTN
jgi:ABC-2 type transport system ATP-binding protein